MNEPVASLSDDRYKRYESLQAALDLIDQGFTLIDRDLRFVAWNKTFLRLLDFPMEMGYVGAPFESFIRYNAERGDYGPGDAQRHVQERVQAARAFAPHEIERTRPDGSVLLVRGVPVPGHGFVTLYSDITAQRAAERLIGEHTTLLESRVTERTAALHRSEARMRLITDSIPALVAYFDHRRVYRYINRGYREWFGLDPAHPDQASARQYLGTATYEGIRPQVMRALTGEAVTFEYEASIVSGAVLTVRTTLIPEIAADASVAGCFELTFDISEQKRAQAMLVQAQKMEALGQLTGGLAHDFNNILTVVLGNLDALARARSGDAVVAEFVEPAAEAARRGADLIKALLSFARKQPLEAQAADVTLLIASVGRLVRRSLPEHLQLDMAAGDAPLWAWVDTHQLQNALLNLVLNARDASPLPGRISVHAGLHNVADAQAQALQVGAGQYLLIEVSDNGAGMDAATQARAFEPFFTTKTQGQGTGLGLPMVYGFVRQSGGAIHLASTPGRGTTVSVWLPALAPGAVQANPASAALDTAEGDQGLALLVDDEAAVRQVVRRQLLDLGYVVIEAENGAEAMQILEKTPGIALLLADVVMPGEVDGRALARFARQRCGVRRVVLMSGFAPALAQADAQPVLAKPFTRSQLAALIEAAAS